MIVFQEAEPAVHAAVAMQRAFDAYNREHPELSLRVRIGIHTGEVIREGDDFFGKAVVIATRVTSAAIGGEILISEAVERVLRGSPGVEFGERRMVPLKGLPGEHAVVPVQW
jgi:class 3 adenylate cyclase